MPDHDSYLRARRVNETLQDISLEDLNPTFGELRHILGIMKVGFGEGFPDHYRDLEEVEKLLKRKGIPIKRVAS